jgi:hypothetical protein
MQTQIKLSKAVKNQLFILNQIFEIEKKVERLNIDNTIGRNIDKLKNFYENDFDENTSFVVENPITQKYSETRTDVEASISGDSTENLIITDVIKPIIRIKQGGTNQIIQNGIVVVQDSSTIQQNKKSTSIEKKNRFKNNKTNKNKRQLKKRKK